jgi:hypothetical protein
MRDSSQVYMRFGFFLGFAVGGSAALYLACQSLGIPFETLWDGAALKDVTLGKKVIFLIVPLAVSFVAGLAGALLFANIGRGNAQVEAWLGSLWHYSSTGLMIWVALSVFQFVFSFGGTRVKDYPAMKASLVSIGAGLASGALICLAVRIGELFRRRGHVPLADRLARLAPMAIGVTTGVWQSWYMHLAWWPGVLAGLLYPFVLIPWAQSVCLRDGLK